MTTETLHLPESWKSWNQHRLSTEERVIFLPGYDRDEVKWAREYFVRRRRGIKGLVAYSTDKKGNVVRIWKLRPGDVEIYRSLGNTCPIEAVWLDALEPRIPGIPAFARLNKNPDEWTL